MISNDRQYRISKAQIERLKSALAQLEPLDLIKDGIDPIIIEAQRRGIVEQIRDIELAVSRYESLRDGKVRHLMASTVSDLGKQLIDGRIARGLTQRQLGERLGIHEQQIQRYEHEFYHSATLARIAEVVRSLRLDASLHFSIPGDEEFEKLDLSGEEASFDPKKLPVKEMKRRGWLDNVHLQGESDLETDIEIAAAYISQSTGSMRVPSLHKQNLNLKPKSNYHAILAWKARVLSKARATRNQIGEERPIDPIFLTKLVGLSRTFDGVVDAVSMLKKNGIAVVFEEHMQSTYLDGAALLLDNQIPVIALTLRHDRVDNFWFVLLHEIGHIVRHRDQGLKDGFFDDDSVPPVDRMEQEADEFAINALISQEKWANSFVRFTRSKEQVLEFAKRIGVGAAIVAGRIRHERKDYKLFGDLVGSGEVRKRISGANLMEM